MKKITGAAFVTNNGITTFRRKWQCHAEPMEMLAILRKNPEVQDLDFTDFRRTAPRTRFVMLAAAAVKLDHSGILPENISMIGYVPDGVFPENKNYFSDYLNYGREIGRGSLFVPTLSTTPLCEAAITLRLHGPAWCVSGSRAALRQELSVMQTPLFLLILRQDSAAVFILEDSV